MRLKPYKIRVPEYCMIDHPDSGSDYYYKEINRQEIHELIQNKAVELGYIPAEISNNYNSPYVFLSDDGELLTCWTVDESYDKSESTPITWQDFLKLTPGDVEEKGLDKRRTCENKIS